MKSILPTASELCRALAAQIRPHVRPETALVGIRTGGEWIAEWLHGELGLTTPLGSVDVSYYRDDVHQRGVGGHIGQTRPSSIPFEVEGAHIIIVDDVLYTGRTIRAAINELFDYGRPAYVDLAVLVDRGHRELPIAATYCPHSMELPASQTLVLERTDDRQLSFRITEK